MHHKLEQTYRDHRQGLFSLALSITRRPELAEDAVQDAFVRLWRSAISPKGDPVAYVFASVRNAALELVRRRRNAAGVPVSLFDCEQADPASAAIEAEQQQIVRRAVDALPSEQREAVVMRTYAGLTFRQIADVVGEPLPTIASRYRRALERIKETIESSI